jgi:hypothetical protein
MKTKVIKYSREWAMGIVDFARAADGGRHLYSGLTCYGWEAGRIVATDGHRLAWQTYNLVQPEATGVIDKTGALVPDAQFPDYKAVLPGTPNIEFSLDLTAGQFAALRLLSRLDDHDHKAHGALSFDGEQMAVTYLGPVGDMTASLRLTYMGEPKPFRVGISLRYLWEALDACRRSCGNYAHANVAIVDHNTAIAIRVGGFYSITTPKHLDDAFTTTTAV